MAVAILPVTLAYRMYADCVAGLDREHGDRELVTFRNEGVCVVNRDNRITFWDSSLERLLECPRERALGRSIAEAVGASRRTDLPRTMKETLMDRTPRTVSVHLAFATRARVLSVQILPVGDGVSLVWQDVTARSRAEQAHRRTNDWLTVAA